MLNYKLVNKKDKETIRKYEESEEYVRFNLKCARPKSLTNSVLFIKKDCNMLCVCFHLDKWYTDDMPNDEGNLEIYISQNNRGRCLFYWILLNCPNDRKCFELRLDRDIIHKLFEINKVRIIEAMTKKLKYEDKCSLTRLFKDELDDSDLLYLEVM